MARRRAGLAAARALDGTLPEALVARTRDRLGALITTLRPHRMREIREALLFALGY